MDAVIRDVSASNLGREQHTAAADHFDFTRSNLDSDDSLNKRLFDFGINRNHCLSILGSIALRSCADSDCLIFLIFGNVKNTV